MVLHGIAWYCMVLHGIALYCMVLHGIACYCTVWHGIARYCNICNICEVVVPYWGPMITARESNMLERCMKTGLQIIFQENYRSYEHALKQANLKTLRQRRILLMNNFAKKASKSERFNKWFVVESNEEGKSTRTKKPTRLLRQIPCRTQRYERSSLPYLTKLLSWHPPLPAPDLSMK